ncbi:MAG: hypothetical protein H0T73_00500 [Ardenticatenales bacterium]|nr:hypothetical protein [Ardenticatenales bacterium]
MTAIINLAYDCGQGNGKLVGPHGWAILESYAARQRGEQVSGDLDGIRSKRARHQITLENAQRFYVGRNAHSVGEPIEALDYDRYAGSPEQRALFYGILTEYMQKHEVRLERVRLTIGVPFQVLSGAEAERNVQAISGWLTGEHTWQADGERYSLTITETRVKSQAAGALYQYMFDENGHIVRERKSTLIAPKKGGGVQFVPVGILSFGFLTVEAMAVEYQKGDNGELELVKQDRFTSSRPMGLHRLLDVARSGPELTLAELDQQFRDGVLDTGDAMTIYQRDVSGVLIDAWGRSGWKRFGVILLVGGGAVALGDWLRGRFEGRAFLPESPASANGHYRDGRGQDLMPILAIAMGLYREAMRS